MAPPSRPRCVDPDRVLVIHTAFIGDIILATPFLRALRQRFPRAEIRLLTTEAGAALMEPNPWRVVSIPYRKRGADSGPSGFLRKLKEIRSFSPDLVFSLHRSFRSTLLARLSGGQSRGFREAAASFLLDARVSRAGHEFEAQKNLALLGEGEFSPYPELVSSASGAAEAQKLLDGLGKFIVLAPSSVWATKRWPAERFAALSDMAWRELGISSVVIGSDAAEDRQAAGALVASVRASSPRDISGSTSLNGLKSVLSRAELVVANDSSPLHMAIAMGTKALGIFGPTTRDLGFFPLAPSGRAGVAEISGLDCRPCGLHGHRECPLGHFRCMLELTEGQVFAEVKKLLCP